MLAKLFRRIASTLALGLALLAVGIGAYAVYVRASATALINSARKIHSTADAEREIAIWRKRSGAHFWKESDHLGGEHNFDGQIENLSLARFGVVEPAAVTLSVTTRGRELRCITLMMTAGRRPMGTPSVWVQEWFDQGEAPLLRVSQKDKPRAAIVEFTESVPETQRIRALALNTKCFVQFNGCRSADDILPGVWQLDTLLGGPVGPNFKPVSFERHVADEDRD